MPTLPHRIRRQRWVVRTPSADEAFAWRKLLHDEGLELLAPAVERAFDEVGHREGFIHIPRIELKVDVDSGMQLTEVLPDLIYQQLREQLRPLVQGREQASARPLSWKEHSFDQARFDVLLHYLRTGALAWHGSSDSASENANMLLETCLEEWPLLLDYLSHSAEDPLFHFRLLQLISKGPQEVSTSLVQELSNSIPQAMRTAVVQCVTSLIHSEQLTLNRYTRTLAAAALLSESLARMVGDGSSHPFAAFMEAVRPEEREVLHDLIASHPELSLLSMRAKSPEISQVVQDETVQRPASSFTRLQPMRQPVHPAETVPQPFVREPSPKRPQASNDYMVHSTRVEDTEDPFPLMVHQAGLVILHPFIAHFFEATGVVEKGGKQIPASALPHAAALLHFLAVGGEAVYEYELGLIKILLGLRPKTPLPVCAGLLAPADREEAEVLLQSAITHWSILKNTSVHGLRSSFLQRQGLLHEEENGWKLHLERMPYDILLDQLPWSISFVRLPWMKKAISTEW